MYCAALELDNIECVHLNQGSDSFPIQRAIFALSAAKWYSRRATNVKTTYVQVT